MSQILEELHFGKRQSTLKTGNESLLAVGIVCGGHDEYVIEALDSVLNQSVEPHEIIILLNGRSNEVGRRIIDRISEHQGRFQKADGCYPNIRLDRTTQRLLTSEAVKRVLMQTNSEFLVMVGDDDVIDPDFVRVVQRVLRTNILDRVYVTRHVPFRGTLRSPGLLPENPAHKYGASPWKWLNRLMSASTSQIAGGGTVFPVQTLINTGALESPIPVVVEDWLISLRFARNGYRGVYVQDAVYYVRDRAPVEGATRQPFDFGVGVFRSLAIQEAKGRLAQFWATAFYSRDTRLVISNSDYAQGLSFGIDEVNTHNYVGNLLQRPLIASTWVLRRVAYAATRVSMRDKN